MDCLCLEDRRLIEIVDDTTDNTFFITGTIYKVVLLFNTFHVLREDKFNPLGFSVIHETKDEKGYK